MDKPVVEESDAEYEKRYLIAVAESTGFDIRAIADLLDDLDYDNGKFEAISRLAKLENIHDNTDYIIELLTCQRCGETAKSKMKFIDACGCRICTTCDEKHNHHGCYRHHTHVAKYDSDDDVYTHGDCKPCCPDADTKVTKSWGRCDREPL